MTDPRKDERATELLERSAELAVLDGLLDTLVDPRVGPAGASPGGDGSSSGRVLLLQGPPGIGKTALVTALRAGARRRGIPVLAARGTELGSGVSFGAVTQLLGTDVPVSLAALGGVAPDGVAVLDGPVLEGPVLEGPVLEGPVLEGPVLEGPVLEGPVLEGTVDAAAATGRAPTGDLALLQELFDCTVMNSGRRGLVVVVDDCHWLDPPSLRFLAYLTSRIRETSVLLLMATRPDAGPGRAVVLDEITGSPGVVVLRPEPLTRAASDQLLTAALPTRPDPAFAAVCFRETGGNPLILGELAVAVAEAKMAPVAGNAASVGRIGAHAVTHRVRDQRARLPTSAGAVLDALAVLGDGAPVDQLGLMVGPDVDVSAAVAALARVGLVHDEPDAGLSFVHPLIRSAVYGTIDPLVRARTHQHAAELLTRSRAGVETVAAHYVALTEDVKLTPSVLRTSTDEVLMRAAAQAMQRGAPESALRYLRRGLAGTVDRRQEMLLLAGQAAFQVDLPSAVEYLEEAIGHVQEPEARVHLAGMLVGALLLTGSITQALDLIEREQRSLPVELGSNDDLRTYLDSCVAMVAVNNPVLPGLESRLRSLLSQPPAGGFGGRSLDGVLALYQASRAEPEAIDRASRAMADGVRVTGESGGGPVPIAVNVLLLADRLEGLEHLDLAVERARDGGSLLAASGAYAYRAHAHLLRGDLPAAYEDATTARWSTAVLGLRNRSFIASVLATTCLELGRYDEAHDVLVWSEVIDAPQGRPFTFFAVAAHATWLRLTGDPEEGLRVAKLAGERFSVGGGVNPAQVSWRSDAALCAHLLGDAVAARGFAEQDLGFARQWGAPRALGRALRVLATVSDLAPAAGSAGSAGGRTELLDEAVAVLRPSIARLELAQCLLARAELAGAERAGAGPDAAVTDLTEALDLARNCKAQPLVTRAELVLAGIGSPGQPG